jgi:fido (protein-threonine AMPylation protein)
LATPWNADPPGYELVLEANASALILEIILAAPSRLTPSVSMAQAWHRALYRTVPLPVPYYAGEVRDSDSQFPELFGYEVAVGALPGVSSRLVPGELTRFQTSVGTAVGNLDAGIPVGGPLGSAELMAVLRLIALVHGEWVRIHPFANGNGRTARVWANWVATRYGLEAFVQLKPRPAHLLYAGAAASLMRGDHSPMVVALHSMLRDYLSTPARQP